MAQILIQKVLNNEILTADLILWITEINLEDENYKDFSEICSQKDFVTYFLNILHDQIVCDRSMETTQKSKTSISTLTEGIVQRKYQLDVSVNHENSKLGELVFSNDSPNHSFNISCTSTPKIEKSYSYDCSIKNFSPIRKIPTSFKRDNENSKTNSICLGDFIITNKKHNSKKKLHKSSSESQKKTPKRINPTNLNETIVSNDFKQCENSFSFENANNISVGDEKVNRDILKKEIAKLSVEKNSIDENVLVQIKATSDFQTKKNRDIFPNLKSVRFKKDIEKIIVIYDTLLRNCLVPSYIGELHFVISMLFSECCESFDSDFSVLNGIKTVTFEELFMNIENVIFFACSILERSVFYLKSLDKSTLKYLSGNKRLKIYSSRLVDILEKISEEKSERLLKLYESNGKQNICFVLDTDNRSNFPSDVSFQSFKKQRDIFYEILKIWEDGHMVPGWNYEHSLGRKIKTLLSYHRDPVNFMRLSRLFMDQLLSTCGKNAMEEILKETSSTLLTSLPNMDRDKLDRLKSRLVTKQPSNSVNSAPDFTGYQDFYKEFIVLSSNINFLRHLCDTFISEIIELNDTTFYNLDTESNDNETDIDTKKAYVNCLKSLRILAKFLGFTESLPYKYETSSLSSNLMDLQIKIRNRVKPNFDVLVILQNAILNGTLTLCVPWICKYLSMLDPVTLKSSYYTKIIEILIEVYRNIGHNRECLPENNVYLIVYTLGWFFELNNFPISTFFEKLTPNPEVLAQDEKCTRLDNLVIVDQDILYIFCPYLDNIKKLLTSKTVLRDRVTVRHITPLTAVESPKEFSRRKIETQLEEAFFNAHPSSIRKTVDFVAERIASTCVKHLCYNIVPEFRKSFTKKLQTELNIWSGKEGENHQADLRTQCGNMAEENLKTLVTICGNEVDKIIENNLKNAIHSLLPMDCLPQMEYTCISAAQRMCLKKVKQWTSTHIVLSILTKDISTEITRFSTEDPRVKTKPVFALPPGGSNIPHNENTESAAHILDKLRDLSVSMLSTSTELEEEFLIEFLRNTYTTLTQRCDVNEAIHLMICQQLLDFLLLIVTFQPNLIEKIRNDFFKIWKLREDSCKELFSNLLCPRNIMLLAQCGSKCSESWSTKASFCVALLKEDLMSCDSFETQCTGFFTSDSDEETLKNVTKFLRIFVEKYKKESNSSKFTYLLEFLSDYCSDL